MPTNPEMVDRIKRDLARKDRPNVTAAQVRDALLTAPVGDRTDLLAAIAAEQDTRAGTVLNKIVTEYLEGLAETEATTMMTDDSLTLAELSRWLD